MRPFAAQMVGGRILLVGNESGYQRLAVRGLRRELALEVETADTGTRALEMLQSRAYRFLLADEAAPGRHWQDLVQFVRDHRPETRYALVASGEVDNLLELALEYDVGNVLDRSSPQLFRDILETVQALLTEDVFGLERWLGPDAETHFRLVARSGDIDEVARDVAAWFPDGPIRRAFRRALQEIVTNAVHYAVRHDDGARKQEWDTEFVLRRDEEVYVFFGLSPQAFGCSVVDRGGRLRRRDLLTWLAANAREGALLELSRGRGLSITRRSLDRVVVNVRRGESTEMILLHDREETRRSSRSLMVHEF